MPPTDLIVLSHLRWTWVWQRPQQLVSRLARGRRTWFVEEPHSGDVEFPRLCFSDGGPVTRVWLEVPGPDHHVGFGHPAASLYSQHLSDLLGPAEDRAVWLYTPMALDIARALSPSVLVYDLMDDLASFKGAPPELGLRHHQALREADLVFAGGRSLYRAACQHRPLGTYLFQSGVEPEHYASAPRDRRRPMPVAGYVGVIDERLDLELIAGLAAALEDWEIQMVGPVTKIDPTTLPRPVNLAYKGPQPYERLPHVMADLDVALMPFALNEATRSISPTKTLEYLAAGLPVVSTPVPDVVADYGHVVEVHTEVAAFADACRRSVTMDVGQRADKVRPLLQWHHWDSIAARMEELIGSALAGLPPSVSTPNSAS